MGSSWGLALRDAARAFAARRGREEGEEEAAVDEAGFTLIELMVVLLIMGILMAIAIPTFLGAASGAHDKASQSDITNAMTSAKAVYAANGSYTATQATLVTTLHSAEPEMAFQSGTTAGKPATNIVVKSQTTGNVLVMASWSTTGHCWFGIDDETQSAVTGTGTGATAAQPGVSYAVKAAATHTLCSVATLPTKWTRSWPKA